MQKLLPFFTLLCALFVGVAVAPAADKAKKSTSHALKVSTDRSDAIYPRGQTVTFTVPTEPGSYYFDCQIHPAQMFGTFEVTA